MPVTPPPAEPFNTADQQQVEKKQKLAALRDQERLQALQQLMSTRGGRSWLWSMLARCNVFSMSFDAGNPHVTSFNEGMRNAGNFTLAEIMRADPAVFPLMQKEASEDLGG